MQRSIQSFFKRKDGTPSPATQSTIVSFCRKQTDATKSKKKNASDAQHKKKIKTENNDYSNGAIKPTNSDISENSLKRSKRVISDDDDDDDDDDNDKCDYKINGNNDNANLEIVESDESQSKLNDVIKIEFSNAERCEKINSISSLETFNNDNTQSITDDDDDDDDDGGKDDDDDVAAANDDDDDNDDDVNDDDDGDDDDDNNTSAKKTTVNVSKVKPKGKIKPKNSSSDTIKAFDPLSEASWKPGEDVPFLNLARVFDSLEHEAGRLLKIEFLCNFFRCVIVTKPEQLLACAYLCINTMAPAFSGQELGVGDAILKKAIKNSTGVSAVQIREQMQDNGDLGVTAEALLRRQKRMFAPKCLTAIRVLKAFRMISNSKGDPKLRSILQLLVASRECESRFIVRAMQGNLRIGGSLRTVLDALARAIVLTPPAKQYKNTDRSTTTSMEKLHQELEHAKNVIRCSWNQLPSLDIMIPALLEYGINNLHQYCHLTPGIPVKAMLAHPAQSIHQVVEAFKGQAITMEYKYDGERAQIHVLQDGTISIFSRNLENNTSKYPDIISMLPQSFGSLLHSCIIDSEVVAFDIETKQIRPFQVLTTRKRKNVDKESVQVQVALFVFDVLYMNGKSLLDEALLERRKILHNNFNTVENKFFFAQYTDNCSAEHITEYLQQSVEDQCEGLMIKSLIDNSNYEPDKRSHAWFKLKKDYVEGAADTFDVVPIGAYFGKGKRTGWYGGFLLACYDAESEQYQTLTKIGTGFSDEVLAEHAKQLAKDIIDVPRSYYVYPDKDLPDVWFKPRQVWEVKASDLSISPHHKAAIGIVHDAKGIALRFPRFVRVRDDKTPEDATTSEQVADYYRNQHNKQT